MTCFFPIQGLIENGLFHSCFVDSTGKKNDETTATTANSSISQSLTNDILKPHTLAQQQRNIQLHRFALPLNIFAKVSSKKKKKNE